MDDRLREKLVAWLEFYQELGLEELYRRSVPVMGPRPKTVETKRSPVSSPQPPATAQVAAAPSPVEAARPLFTAAESLPHRPMAAGPPARTPSLFETPAPARGRETLEQVREDLGDCHRCRLAAGRKTIVFGQGNPRAEVVFVGEGPGVDEDEQGLPFVGRAGQLLNRMILMIGMKREDVYICNVVKCRPPGNRTPERDEIEACSPFLFRQIEAIHPRLVCCLGAPAVRTVLGIKEGITKIRGQFFDYGPTKALATVHPAYVLRNPREEKVLREDFEKLRDFLRKPR